MATYDWSLPTTTTNYSTFVTEVHNRLDQVAKGFVSTDTHNNLTAGAISFRSNKWQTWSGSAWSDLAATYAISISGSAGSLTSTLTADKGGTGFSAYTIGDLLVGASATTVSKLSTPTGDTVLISTGTGTKPSWTKIDLTKHLAAGTVLPIGNGGTGSSTAITGIIKGTGSAYAAAVAGTDYAAASHTHDYLSAAGGTLTGNLSLINGTTERSITIGSSGGYLYGNATSYGIYKASGASFSVEMSTGNVAISGALTVGGSISSTSGTLTLTNGNLSLSSGDISVTGNITASGSITSSSDIKLKHNIVQLENALNKVTQLRGVSYTKAGTPEIGVIAQEVELVVPEVVYDGEYKSVAYGNLVALLIEAIKELNEKLDARTSN